MLTHHQYTYIQKEQNIAVSNEHSSIRKYTDSEPRIVDTSDHISLRSSRYERIGWYKGQQKKMMLDSHGGVMRNHFGNNIVFRINRQGLVCENQPRVAMLESIRIDSKNRSKLKQGEKEDVFSSNQVVFSPNHSKSNAEDDSNGGKSHEKNIMKEKINKISQSAEYLEALSYFEQLDWDEVSNQQFLIMATDNLQSSTALQKYIQSEENPPMGLLRLVVSCIDGLLPNKFGCHIVRSALLKSQELMDCLKAIIGSNFIFMCSNQFSNKVLQSMAETDQLYRDICLKYIVKDWEQIKLFISSNYLLSVCLKLTPNDNMHFKMIGKALMERLNTLTKDKFNKRFLTSYIEYCPQTELHVFFKSLRFDQYFLKRCEDKYMIYIFGVMLKRNHHKSIETMKQNFESHLSTLMESNHFRQLILSILKNEEAYSTIHRHVYDTLNSKMGIVQRYEDVLYSMNVYM